MEAELHISSCAFILVNGHPLLAKMGKNSVDSEMPRYMIMSKQKAGTGVTCHIHEGASESSRTSYRTLYIVIIDV